MSSACVDYVPALCTHRPSLLPIEWSGEFFGLWQRFRFAVLMPREDTQTLSFRGRRSRNKVSVGEPAEGSLSFLHPHFAYCFTFVITLWLGLLMYFSSSGLSTSPPCFGSLVRALLVDALFPFSRALRECISKIHNSCRWISWHEQR